MRLNFGEAITLPTEFGVALVRHFACEEEAERCTNGGQEGVIISKSLTPKVPTVLRLHSSCLFGEAFHGVDCDCGQQLAMGLSTILDEDGLLVYFYEEGRGVGLRKKMEAIKLQQELNIDTATAYERLGLKRDPRTYMVASSIVKHVLGDGAEVILLSNNPSKRAALEENGVHVLAMRPLIPKNLTAQQRKYLTTKGAGLGHLISESMLRQSVG
jgi:GTP cyclohydrolase II